MRIQYNKEGYVDFEAPIHLEDDQFDNLISFLKELTGRSVEIRNTEEKGRFGNTAKRKSKKWISEELILLLDASMDEQEIAKSTERTEMSVSMQRAQFVPEFVSWARKKGYNSNKISKTLIDTFMEEKNDNSKGQ